ncbi:acyltransferase family protein [Erwinia sp.]|uniref:acyltransferase family protein n=1 Tax=Erwinia citreus TaxID=558 RepID=UPI003C71BF52
MKFRGDINGLRAYAVILVLLYHFGFMTFSGGFIGVDVFFVISGYLMTGIISAKLNTQTFSLSGFYAARCKRIIPPLLVMCVLLLLTGYFVIPPEEYATLAKHVAASLTFISNVVYFKESGYFEAGAIYKWLLHTWSLSVEWQFYLILPIVLMVIAKFFRRKYALALSLFSVISLLLAVYLSKNHGSLAYFMLPTRAWEMMAGGLVYYASQGKQSGNQLIPTLGLAVLIATAMWVNAETAWPGLATLIPVVATCMIIYSGGDKNLLLNNGMVQKVGSWSYSIYLYHWPLLVMWNLAGFGMSLLDKVGLLGLSLLCGWASWQFIERNSAKILSQTPRVLASSAVVICLSVAVLMMNGLQYRAPALVKTIDDYSKDKFAQARGCFVLDGAKSPQCVFGNKASDVDLVVIGDSHANALLSSVVSSSNGQDDSIVYIAQSSCPTIPDITRKSRPSCGLFVQNALKDINTKYPHASILVINRISLYLHGENNTVTYSPEFSFKGNDSSLSAYQNHFSAAVKELSAVGRKVFIMTPVPEFDFDVISKLSRNAMVGNYDSIQITRAEYESRNKDALAMLNNIELNNNNVTLLDAAQALCDQKYCYGSKEGLPLYRDSNHLSEFGNKALTPVFASMWQAIKATRAARSVAPVSSEVKGLAYKSTL